MLNKVFRWLDERWMMKYSVNYTIPSTSPLYEKIGSPTEKDINKLFIEAYRVSGEVAICKLIDVIGVTGFGTPRQSWLLLVFKFDHYKKPNEKDYPKAW